MKVGIIGSGAGVSKATNMTRWLNENAQIDIFTHWAEIRCQPSEIPFVLKGELDSW